MTTPQILTFFLSVLIVLLCVFNTVVVSDQLANFIRNYELPQGVTGPESPIFRRGLLFSQGPYTTVLDGRILKWQGSSNGFVEFAYTSPNRTKQLCDGTADPNLGPTCGRPIDLSFQPLTGNLFIADACYGLLVVGPNGGLATQLVGGFKFVTGVDVDPLTGRVYFTDASLTFNAIDVTQPGFVPDSTGRLLRYNPYTGQTSVLLSGLSSGASPAVNNDGRFVLVPEYTGNRILKYWLAGPKSNTSELLLNVTGNPFKIKRAERLGEFWAAVSIGDFPRASLVVPQGVRFNSNGFVLQTLSFEQYFNKSISVVQEYGGKLYIGSRETSFIGVYYN